MQPELKVIQERRALRDQPDLKDRPAPPGRGARLARQELMAILARLVPRDLQARRAHKALPGRRDRTDKPGQRAPRGHRARASPAQQGQLAPLDPGAIPARPDLPERSQV